MSRELTYTKQVNANALCVELSAALGQAVESVAVKGDQVFVYLRDDNVRDADIDAVIAAHEYALPVVEQRSSLQQLAGVLINGIDFEALDTQIESMTAQEMTRGLYRAIYLLAVAQGLTENTKQAERAALELGQYFGLIDPPIKG